VESKQFYKTLNKVSRLALSAFVFCIPFQLSLFAYQGLWGRGFINPYISTYFTISEFFLLVSGVAFVLSFVFQKTKKIKLGHHYFFFSLLLYLSAQVLALLLSPAQDSLMQVLSVSKFLELILLYLLICNRVLRSRELIEVFVVSMAAQACLAIFQFSTQSSLGLHLLGEPHLSESSIHISRFIFSGKEWIRAYGTLPHPNILGGFLCVSILASLLMNTRFRFERSVLILLQSAALMFTFSRSAILALVMASLLIVYWYFHELRRGYSAWLIPTVFTLISAEVLILAHYRGFTLFNDASIIDRLDGLVAAFHSFFMSPFGLGPGQSTLMLDQVFNKSIMPWEYQPPHNIFVLSLAESGFIGLSSLFLLLAMTFYLLYKRKKKLLTSGQRFKKRVLLLIFASMAFIGMFDHYLLTLDQGRQLFIFFFAIAASFSDDPRHVLPIKKGGDLDRILPGRA
jgi:O-antigen ligase